MQAKMHVVINVMLNIGVGLQLKLEDVNKF
jgi:hypothetical protein